MTHQTPDADQTNKKNTVNTSDVDPGIPNAFSTPEFGIDGTWDFQTALDPVFNELIFMEPMFGGNSF